MSHQEKLIKNFPLLNQMDNEKYPSGSCNMTSLAMVLTFYNLKPPRNHGFDQVEDTLLHICDTEGLSRHDPATIKRLAERFGLRDELIMVNTWEQTGKVVYNDFVPHLLAGKPAIVHGMFTASGHIACVDGIRLIDGKISQVHIADPYGEWFPSGYRINYGGDSCLGRYWMSYSAFATTALKDGEFWVHLLEKA